MRKFLLLSLNLFFAQMIYAQCTTGLVISAYIEGSSNNKCIEIYNPTNAGIDLSNCQLERYSNGGSSATNISLGASTLASGTYFLICNSGTDMSALGQAGCVPDISSGSVSHNGDDTYALTCGGVVQDGIGAIGAGDPGTEWGSGTCSTANNSLFFDVENTCQTWDPTGASNAAYDAYLSAQCGNGYITAGASNDGSGLNACAPASSCGITALGTASINCLAQTPGTDMVEVSISYTGVQAGATITNNGMGAISGDDPATVTNGTIVITLNEGQMWDIEITHADCSGLTASGTVDANECRPCPDSQLNFQMINPCGNDGDNEFISFSTGSATVNVDDLAFGVINAPGDASWNYFWGGSNVSPTDYGCQGVTSSSTTYGLLDPTNDAGQIATLVAELNGVAGCAPPLFIAAPEMILPGSDVIVFLGAGDADGFDDVATNLDFSNNCGNTYYAVFGTGTDGGGYFSNSNPRTSILDFGGGCDCATTFDYNPSSGSPGYVFNGSDYATGGPCVPPSVVLPVDLLFLNGRKADDRVVLNWATANEVNNDYFEVEWSKNGRDFEVIGMEDGFGNTYQETHYAHNHKTPVLGHNYYRLRQVDLDGSFAYSSLVVVDFKQKGNIRLSSSLSSGQIDVEFVGDEATVEVYDIQGRRLVITNLKQSGTLDVSAIESGIYIVTVTVGEEIMTKKLVK